MTLARFTEIWCRPDDPAQPVSESDLQNVERRLRVHLPKDYREAILEIGLPQTTIALLDAIVERNLDLHCVGDFYTPIEIIEDTIGWREIGMPDQLIAFASDGCGNKFCFDANQLNDATADSYGVWFYDHDFDTVDQIAPNFSAWIDAFCQVEPWTPTDPY